MRTAFSSMAREHRLKIAGRTADNLEHLRGGRLLLQRFCEVGRAFAKVVGALAQFVEQPRVLDGDDGLRGEILDQFDLLVGEGTNFLTVKRERTNQLVLLQHRNSQKRPYTPEFDCGDQRQDCVVRCSPAPLQDRLSEQPL